MCNRYRPSRAQIALWEDDPDNNIPNDWGIAEHLLQPHADIGPRGPGWFVSVKNGVLQEVAGTWGLIGDDWLSPEPPKVKGRAKATNNARIETIHRWPTFRGPWKRGQRCLIPAAWWCEPRYPPGPPKDPKRKVPAVWWSIRRAGPYASMMAGIYNSWSDPETGEIFESYSMVTRNCDEHELLSQFHKWEVDLPADRQDKRAVVALHPSHYMTWLAGTENEARGVLVLPPLEELEAAPIDRPRPPEPTAGPQIQLI